MTFKSFFLKSVFLVAAMFGGMFISAVITYSLGTAPMGFMLIVGAVLGIGGGIFGLVESKKIRSMNLR